MLSVKGMGRDISRKKLQHTMPGNTNVFDYLTKVKQRSRQWCDTASLVFTVWTLVGDSTSRPGLATAGSGGLSMLLRVVTFTLLILKIKTKFFFKNKVEIKWERKCSFCKEAWSCCWQGPYRKWSLLLNGFMPLLGHGKDKYANSIL